MTDPATETRRRMGPCARCKAVPVVQYDPGCLWAECCQVVAVPDCDMEALLDLWHGNHCGPATAAWWRAIRERQGANIFVANPATT